MNWILAAGLGAVALTVVIGLWARRRLVLVTVKGSSMEPTLFPGDRVLVHRRRLDRVRRGQLVVLEPPPMDGRIRVNIDGASLDHRLWNIKRAVALPGDPVPPAVKKVEDTDRVPRGALVVLGDNAASTDSRQRGFFFAADLLGVVMRRMSTGEAKVKPK